MVQHYLIDATEGLQSQAPNLRIALQSPQHDAQRRGLIRTFGPIATVTQIYMSVWEGKNADPTEIVVLLGDREDQSTKISLKNGEKN